MGKKRKPPPPHVDPATVPLTEGERRFVDEYLVDRKRVQAYRRAYPNNHSYRASQMESHLMFHQANVQAEIRSAVAAQRARVHVRADAVIEEYARIAFSDIYELFDPATNQLRMPRHIPLETRKAVQSIKVSRQRRTVTARGRTRTTVTDTVMEYRLWSKTEALSKLWTHLGLQTEMTPLESFLALLPADLAAHVRMELAKGNAPVGLPLPAPQ